MYDDGANELADDLSGILAELAYIDRKDEMGYYVSGLVKIIQGSAILGYELNQIIRTA